MWWLGDPSGGLEKVADSLQQGTEAVTCLALPAGLGALPACGSRVILVHIQPTLERVEGLPGGLPAGSTGMGEFCACDSHRLVSRIFAGNQNELGPSSCDSELFQSRCTKQLTQSPGHSAACPPSLLQDLGASWGLAPIWCWDFQPLFDV